MPTRALSPSTEPLVSIIIPTRNRVEYLSRALQSIFAAIEQYRRTEVIVVDGASTDGTVELLKSYGSRVAYWISEPDSSVGEAVNKGLGRAWGEIIHLAADDDEFLPHTIRFMVDYLMQHPEADAVSAEAEYLKEDSAGNFTALRWEPAKLSRWRVEDIIAQDPWGFPSGLWPEQQFSRRRVFVKSGGYDIRYKYFGYIELFCRQVYAKAIFHHLPDVILRRIFTPKSDIYNQSQRHVDLELSKIYWTYGGATALLRFWYRRIARRHAKSLWQGFLEATVVLRHPFRARVKQTTS